MNNARKYEWVYAKVRESEYIRVTGVTYMFIQLFIPGIPEKDMPFSRVDLFGLWSGIW